MKRRTIGIGLAVGLVMLANGCGFTEPSNQILTVQSTNPSAGVAITYSAVIHPEEGTLAPHSAATPFTVSFATAATVTLAAPAVQGSNAFASWTGCDRTTGSPATTCIAELNGFAGQTVTANYGPPTHTLTVASSPNSGVTIAASPNDNAGSGGGNTQFALNYAQGTAVTLTAPAAGPGGTAFANWAGCDTTSGTPATTCKITMNVDHTVTASYATPVVPSLNITMSHAGNFVQGQQNAAYFIIVSNAGAAPTNGTVTVTETLPAGLSPVTLSGLQWTCSGNTCTRSDALNAGASYPLITATVNVGIAATSPQVNSASVSGGGSATANVTDSTIIDVAPPVAPTITRQPFDSTVSVNQPANFTVIATGTAPLAYQWQKNGADITGATSFIYSTPPTTVADNGATFRVKVSNAGGSVTSRDAVLTVTGGQTIGAIELVSENFAGTGGGNALSDIYAAVNFDGSSVAFVSQATDLQGTVALTQAKNVYLRHTCAGIPPGCNGGTEVVSVDNNGIEGDNISEGNPGISADGFIVSYGSLATNLVPPPPNPFGFVPFPEIYFRDLCSSGCASPTTEIASLNSNGEILGSSFGEDSAVSSDGRYIALTSSSLALEQQVYLRDTCRGAIALCVPTTILVSADDNGNPADRSCSGVSVSAHGRFVTFSCPATNLVPGLPGVTSVISQVYLRDTQMGTTTLISRDSAGLPGAIDSDTATISDDGRFVSFRSLADLVPQDTNHTNDAYLRDTCIGTSGLGSCTPTTILVSVGTSGNATSQGALPVPHSLDSTGRFVAFDSGAADIVPIPPASFSGIYVRDTCGGPNFPIPACTPKTVLVSVDSTGKSLSNVTGGALSGDGHYIVFASPDPFHPGSGTLQLILALTSF